MIGASGSYVPPHIPPLSAAPPSAADAKGAAEEKESFFKDVKPSSLDAPLSGGIKKPSKGEDRVALSGAERDSRLFIRKMEVPKDENAIARLFRSLRWVRVKEGDREIYLNIRSVASRFLYTRAEVEAMAATGGLTQGLKDRILVLKHLKDIPGFKEEAAKGEIGVKLSREAPFFKEIAGGIPDVLSPIDRQIIMTHFIFQDKPVFLRSQGNKDMLLVSRSREGRLSVISLGTAREIGKGGFGKVYEIYDVALQKFFAMKVGRGVLEEAGNLEELPRRGITGAQSAPELKGILPGKFYDYLKPQEREFMIGELFVAPHPGSPDLHDWMQSRPPKAAKNQCVKQIWSQYKKMQQAGVYHGDLKPANIFVTTDDQGQPQFKFGDWGKLQDQDGNVRAKIYTSKYMPREVIQIIKDESVDADQRAIAAACHDRFAIGLSLYQMLTGGDFPYLTAADRFHIPGAKFDEKPLIDAGCSRDMIDFLKKMTSLEVPDSKAAFEAQQKEINGLWEKMAKRGEFG